jgi:hypothetical protein
MISEGLLFKATDYLKMRIAIGEQRALALLLVNTIFY